MNFVQQNFSLSWEFVSKENCGHWNAGPLCFAILPAILEQILFTFNIKQKSDGWSTFYRKCSLYLVQKSVKNYVEVRNHKDKRKLMRMYFYRNQGAILKSAQSFLCFLNSMKPASLMVINQRLVGKLIENTSRALTLPGQ